MTTEPAANVPDTGSNTPKRRRTTSTSQRARAHRTKPETLLSLLKRRNGASTEAACKALGWQAHTLRAAISRLRKAGHEIETRPATADRGPLYKLMPPQSAPTKLERTRDL